MTARLLLLLPLLAFAAAPREVTLAERYADPAGRFAMLHPDRWTAKAGGTGSLTVLTAPPESRRDDFQETVGVGVQSFSDGEVPTLAEARAKQAEQMRARGAILADSDGRVSLAGRPAHRFTWLLDAGGTRVSIVQFLAVDQGRLFVVTFTTQAGHEHIYRDAAQAMLDSFEIDPPPPATQPSE